jgi:hypothetical protein
MRSVVNSVGESGWKSKEWDKREEEGGREYCTWTRSPRSAREKDARTFWSTSPSPALSTPAMLGANQVSQTRQRSVLKWILARPKVKDRRSSDLPRVPYIGKVRYRKHTPSTSPSKYCGRKADMNAERWEESAACVCSIPKVGSCVRSFCSAVCNCVRSSSSSDDTAVVL